MGDEILDTAIPKRKRVVVLLVAICFIVCLAFVVVYRAGDRTREETDVKESVMLDIPDGEVSGSSLSKSEAYKTGTGRTGHSYEAYFDSLVSSGPEGSIASGYIQPVPDGNSVPPVTPVVPDAGPRSAAELLEIERTSYGSGERGKEVSSDYSGYRPMSRQERIEHDRAMVEMAVQMASDTRTSDLDTAVAPASPGEMKTLELKPPVSDGIITSLDDDIGSIEKIHYRDSGSYPVKCMFLRDEKVRNGQRIIFRLLEDLEVDGILLPANTRLPAVCTIGERLFMDVGSVEYDGRIVRLGYSAYDTDGAMGIYCPETGAVSAGKQIKDDAVNTVSSAISGFFGQIGNAFVRTGANLLQSGDGVSSVSVVSGYEFYIYKENER